jgi:hypothetical protein
MSSSVPIKSQLYYGHNTLYENDTKSVVIN